MGESERFAKHTIVQKYGMEGIGDMEMDWLSPKEQELKWEKYRNYVEECRRDGRYGKEYSTVIEMEHCPYLDYVEQPPTSTSIVIWNIGDEY